MSKINLIALPGKQEVIITNHFDAPRELVFKAFTDSALIPQWWGLRSNSTVVDRLEPRKGGVWRFVQSNAQGEIFAFNGVFHEVSAPSWLVQTFEYEGMPGHVFLETMLFEEENGQTKVTNRMVFQSVEDRDGMVMSGMEGGEGESAERLAELLAKVVVK